MRSPTAFSPRSYWRSPPCSRSDFYWRSQYFGIFTTGIISPAVTATCGMIVSLKQGLRLVGGAAQLSLPMPELFSGSVKLAAGLLYPVWRLVVIASGLAVAALLYWLVAHTRIGMLVRAG